IPALIRKCLEAKERGDSEIEVWGDGSPTREFLYVKDAAEGVVLAAERYNDSEPVNLGSAQEISVKDLVALIARLTEFEGRIVWNTTKPHGQPRRPRATSRGEAWFGCRARTDFAKDLARTIQWSRHCLLVGGVSRHASVSEFVGGV